VKTRNENSVESLTLMLDPFGPTSTQQCGKHAPLQKTAINCPATLHKSILTNLSVGFCFNLDVHDVPLISWKLARL
jgi:hypothetical protein